MPAVSQAFRLLRHVAASDAPEGVSAIARAVGISPSSCFNLLKTLVAEGALQFDEAAKTYRMGTALQALAGRHDPAVPLARPLLTAMAARHGAASAIWALGADRLTLLAVGESELATRIHMTIGQRLPMLVGAMGRCVAAYSSLDGAAVNAGYARLRWARPPGLEIYKKQVAQARRRGWSLDDGHFMHGVTTVAAPVRDRAGGVRYCIANTFFQGQVSPASLRRIGVDTLAQARQLGERLFGAP